MPGIVHPLFWLGVSFLLISLYFFISGKHRLSILFLIAGALALNTFSALLDPFLNLWDERFHALVAKNLLHHPLKPTLYDDPVVPMAYDRWDRYTIWLHKQPLFLWQIMVSFKLFGINEIALRIPAIIQGTLIIAMVYRVGKLVINARTGYYAAFLFATSFFFSDLISGRQSLDQNDLAFLFYITASLWAFAEYLSSKSRWWIFGIGLFAGCAILCKWLVGLFIFLPWGFYVLASRPQVIRKYTDLLLALSITLLIALPWQVLILSWYPSEASQAYKLNSLHLTQVIKPHGGDNWYYLDTFKLLYGNLASWIVILALYILGKRMENRKLFYALFVVAPLFVYLFFTVAKTKMLAFPYIVSPLVYLALGALADTCVTRIRVIKLPKPLVSGSVFILLAVTGWYNLDYALIRSTHMRNHKENPYSEMMMENRWVFKSIKTVLPENSVIFNVKGRHYIECMFYTGFPSYNFIPDPGQYEAVKNAHRTIVVFSGDRSHLPAYLSADPAVILLPQVIRGYD